MRHDRLSCAFLFLYSYNVIIFYIFFFSSRRRHTRSLRDWSSDVCSSDLTLPRVIASPMKCSRRFCRSGPVKSQCNTEWRSEERRVGKGVDLGGRRIIKKKKEKILGEVEKEHDSVSD